MCFPVNSEQPKKENILEKVHSLPKPKKKILFWFLFGLVVLASLFYWLPKIGRRLSDLGSITGEDLFVSQEDEIKEVLDKKEDLKKNWETLQKNKEIMERLEQAQSEQELIDILEELEGQGELEGIEIEGLKKELETD